MAGQLWSENPDKAWAERWFLVQSPAWMIAVGVVLLSGWVRGWADGAYLAFGCATAAPAVLGPLWIRSGSGRRPARESHWLKLNLWVAIVVVFGTYVGTHYFFDLMGMRYGFPVHWNLSSSVVGRTPGTVPLFMYPLTQAYFVTYFVVLEVAWRWLRTRFSLGRPGSALAVLALAYAVAFAETFFMANDALAGYFEYADRGRMLALGSLGYAAYFVVGLPMVARIDERGSAWPLRRVALEALATCMMIMALLELWAQIVGPL